MKKRHLHFFSLNHKFDMKTVTEQQTNKSRPFGTYYTESGGCMQLKVKVIEFYCKKGFVNEKRSKKYKEFIHI